MLTIEKLDKVIISKLENTDRFTSLDAQEVKDELNELLEESGTNVIFSLKNIKFIDSSGIGALISALKRAKSNNSEFKLCEVEDGVMDLLKLMKLDMVFDIYSEVDDCVGSFD